MENSEWNFSVSIEILRNLQNQALELKAFYSVSFLKSRFFLKSTLFIESFPGSSKQMSLYGALSPASKQTNLFHLICSSVLPFFGFPVRPSAKILDSHRSFHRRFPALREGGRLGAWSPKPKMKSDFPKCAFQGLVARN